jgi:hypothetical protein
MAIDKLDLSLILSTSSTVLSVITALLTLRKSVKEYKGDISISCNFKPDASAFTLSIVNTSFRPVTLMAFDLLYMSTEGFEQFICTKELTPPLKLQESELHQQTFSVEELKEAVQQNGVQQRYHHRLFVRIRTTNSGTYHRLVEAPPMKSKTGDTVTHPFICTDILLGLPEMEPSPRQIKRMIPKL